MDIDEREAKLKANEYISVVEPHRVRCAACSVWIKLHSTRQFKMENWDQHEATCPAITGKSIVRSVIKKPVKTVAVNGNNCVPSPGWTRSEHRKADDDLRGFARWEVDLARRRFKNHEAELPLEDQHQILINREKYSNKRFHDLEARKLDSLLKDPITFKALKTLEKGEATECFLQLYEAALNGKLKEYETVRELCVVITDVIMRQDVNKMKGIRYPAHYLNFATLMRSYGGNSARQFGILKGEIPLPSPRHIRSLVAKSDDALTNPYLIYENMARVKRLVDSIKHEGPVAVAGDCTKVRKRLAYSNDFGGHILGSVWDLQHCIAEDPGDIERIIAEITEAKAEATQVRAILIKIPVPQIPPQVVALIPTDGKDDAAKIVEQHLRLLAMAAELSLPVVSFAADGAASELAAQKLMDGQETSFPSITYDYPLYGIHLKAPVTSTGPVVCVQDPWHAKKTGRNGPQHGTKTESLGGDVVVNQTMVALYETGEAGLLSSDIRNVDKQDDGPARRLFHFKALRACTTGDGEETKIRDGFGGLFPFCPWMHGTDFVEHFFGLARMMFPNFTWAEFLKMVQHVMVRQRILLSGSFKEKRDRKARVGYVLDFDASPLTAMDRRLAEVKLTDSDMNSLVELAFLEASLICTEILYIPAPKPTAQKPLDLAPLGVPIPKAKASGDEESDDDEDDFDDEDPPLTSEPVTALDGSEELRMIALAAHDAARYSALCDDLEDAVKELESQPEVPPVFGPQPPPMAAVIAPSNCEPTLFRSELIDAAGKLSISMMLQARLHWQAGTTTRSEKVSQIDSKYALSRIARAASHAGDDDTEPEKMTHQEASNLARVLQEQNSTIQESKPRKFRELRWKNIAAVVGRLVDSHGEILLSQAGLH
ncbi:hypothetical protein C8J57DRAFT_1437247 [Mycena rebaudengoi]|nr:hypothetical protein C8J57DRAFT_1437247 [Mycena rebaudengoi]